MPPILRVFIDAPSAELRDRLSADAARAGWRVVDRRADADIVVAGRVEAPALVEDEEEDPPVHEALTPRERTVLALLAEGAGNRAIGERLGITDHTVKFHLSAIFGKLGVTTRTAAVRRALRRGLIDL